ncbi:MAG: type I methionyl aminopeptidase [Candidatus Spechtbacteria bacterium RIFCSPLOWO2_01_FULL_46_10]|uniref:Methionine aminopeptidase n=1 Tax=Candidatus Spechtbacteria bacterium RIFCSPLOWO2_01_FULL_46_10 TaxID=1802163 RepID=A0A1G2HFT5_9BACT|nr:MAG: type I methionyl aminopeptidase [Candidatus Spechtbacteria bacterium RIFCSPLOWO2_01_FULL_46_10]
MIIYKSENEIISMRQSGRIAALILSRLQEAAKPGVTTEKLNELAEKLMKEHKVKPAFKNYNGFPASVCTSVNEVVVHGVPDSTPLKDGDLLGLDFGVIYDGWYSDTAVTVGVGKISYDARYLLRVCKKALRLGMKKAIPGNTTGDIGNTIQRYVESEGCNVVRELVGHGIGKKLHEEPEVPNFGKRHAGIVLKEGMVIAIEPMIIAGPADIHLQPDHFGYASVHKHLSAHFEHTVAITKASHEILTKA